LTADEVLSPRVSRSSDLVTATSHSWNSNNIATNVLLYHLQRHSDHHANPTRRYQALRDYQESPVLPTGYAGMILVALVPPRGVASWTRACSRTSARTSAARTSSRVGGRRY
jgi:hypothetical protein